MKITKIYRLSQARIKMLKMLAKHQLTFNVNITVNRQKYAKGSFNFKPTAKNNKEFTEKQVLEIADFMKYNGLYAQDFSTECPSAYWQGITYIFGTK